MESVQLSAEAELLKGAGLHVTQPRVEILKFLATGHGPFSAHDIFRAVKRRGFDLATIYRTLQSLSVKGLVRRADFSDRVTRYEIQHDTHPHHHLKCTSCHKVVVSEERSLKELVTEIAKKNGFPKIRAWIELEGLCRNCN